MDMELQSINGLQTLLWEHDSGHFEDPGSRLICCGHGR